LIHPRNKLRLAVENMIHPKDMNQNPFDYFITLTCGYPDREKGFIGIELTSDEVSRKIRFMKNRLQRELFGKQPFRLNFVPSIETEEDRNGTNGRRSHVHLLCSHPDRYSRLDRTKHKGFTDPFEKLIRLFWRQSGFGSGVVDFRKYLDRNGTSYICKDIKKLPTDIGTLFQDECIDWVNVSLNF